MQRRKAPRVDRQDPLQDRRVGEGGRGVAAPLPLPTYAREGNRLSFSMTRGIAFLLLPRGQPSLVEHAAEVYERRGCNQLGERYRPVAWRIGVASPAGAAARRLGGKFGNGCAASRSAEEE